MTIANKVAISGLVLALLIWLFGIRKINKKKKLKRFMMKTLFILILLGSVLILVGKFAISNLMGG